MSAAHARPIREIDIRLTIRRDPPAGPPPVRGSASIPAGRWGSAEAPRGTPPLTSSPYGLSVLDFVTNVT